MIETFQPGVLLEYRTKRITVSSAELLDLAATAVVLLTCKPDEFILPIWVWFRFNSGSIPYTITAPTDTLDVYFGNPANLLLVCGILQAGLLDQIVPTVDEELASATQHSLQSNLIGQPLLLIAGGNDPTLGNGTLDVIVTYATIAG